jgi:hypothetical protein
MSHTDRFPAAVWSAARFLYDDRRTDLDVSDPGAVLASARTEIETAIPAMLRGDKAARQTIASLCAGAVAVKENASRSPEWIAATAPLRAACCQAQYNHAFDWARTKHSAIRRIARVLTSERKLTAANALWLFDQPREAA